MYRYDVPQHNEGYSAWIELSTFDELPEHHQRIAKRTLAQAMAESSLLEIGGINPHLIPYGDLLIAFPEIDPESIYIITRFKLDRPYKWSPL
jgi:hypothetical protein